MTRQVRLTPEQYDEWQAKVKAQKRDAKPKCNCWMVKHQVCDVCQGVGGKDKRVRGGVVEHALKGGSGDAHENGVKLLTSSLPKAARRNPELHAKGTGPQAGSNPAPSPKKMYDSKWEETYAGELVLRKHAGLIKDYWYHPWTFWLPGHVKLEIDFLIQYPDGLERRLQIMEIKGWHKNIREAMAKLKIAASIWPCFQWTIGKRQKGRGWDETDI